MAAEKNGPVKSIATGATSSAVPTALPIPGNNITWSSPWTEIAVDLGEEDIAFTLREESLDIEGPLDQNRQSEIMFKNGIDTVTFGIYQLAQEAFALSSTNATTSNIEEEGTTITYRAMCFEFTGIGLLYLPKVRIKPLTLSGSIKTQAKMVYEGKVFGTTTIPSGYQWHEFDGS